MPGSFFNGLVPPAPSGPWLYPDYLNSYHIHYLRYIYYLCFLNATGPYPSEIGLEEIKHNVSQKKSDCKKKIRKILIGEAPNVPATYFYNPGTPLVGPWYNPILTSLFPTGTVFATRTDFLMACAGEGFLLMDLFPYDGAVYPATSNAYQSAFSGLPQVSFTYNIINRLNDIVCCLEDQFSIAFGLIRFGNPIVGDPACVGAFNAFLLANGKTLNPIGALDSLRTIPVPGASPFSRVAGMAGLFGPNSGLLVAAGF